MSEIFNLLLATGNPSKLREVRQILAPLGVAVTSLAERPELRGRSVEETGETFAANALIKAQWAGTAAGCVAVADDSGLVVDALDGAPGIYSARYAGDEATDADNNAKLIGALAGAPPEGRRARFVCSAVIFVPAGVAPGPFARWVDRAQTSAFEEAAEGEPVAVDGGVAVAFRGTIEGVILEAPRGSSGFGYDPLFLLPGRGLTTAELAAEQKNALSHRGQAFRKLAAAIRSLTGRDGT